MNWIQIYADEVAPTMARFAAGPPLPIWALLGIFCIVGLGLMTFGKGTARIAGVLPIGFAAFVAYMVLDGQSRADLPARYRVGVIENLRIESGTSTDSRGQIEQHSTWLMALKTSRTAHFDAEGEREILEAATGLEELIVDESLYHQLVTGAAVTAVSYPKTEAAVAFVITADGAVIR